MRISDWSSDVCSSDLRLRGGGEVELGDARKEQEDDMGRAVGPADGPSLAWITQARGSHRSRFPLGLHLQRQSRDGISLARAAGRRQPIRRRDRQSVVSGKSESERVDLGGGRLIKTKKIIRRR